MPPDPEIFALAQQVGEQLRRQGRSLAVAESCTGGLLGAVLTDVPGSSAYFLGGVISYADRVKVEQLQVPEAALRRYGAVSEQTAEAMATGVRELLRADIGVSITGVAGPDAEGAKPVGLTFIGIAAPTLPSPGGGGGRPEKHRRDTDRVAHARHRAWSRWHPARPGGGNLRPGVVGEDDAGAARHRPVAEAGWRRRLHRCRTCPGPGLRRPYRGQDRGSADFTAGHRRAGARNRRRAGPFRRCRRHRRRLGGGAGAEGGDRRRDGG